MASTAAGTAASASALRPIRAPMSLTCAPTRTVGGSRPPKRWQPATQSAEAGQHGVRAHAVRIELADAEVLGTHLDDLQSPRRPAAGQRVDQNELIPALEQPREPGKCIVPLERAHPSKHLIVTDVRAPDAQHHPPGQRLSKPCPVERIEKAGNPAQTHHPWPRTYAANLPNFDIYIRPGPKSTTTGGART